MFIKIQKLFKLKILNSFDSSIYIVVFIQFVLFSGLVFDVVKINILNNQHIFFEHWRRDKNSKWNENDDKRNDEQRISKKNQIDKNLNFENFWITRKKQTRNKFRNILISNLNDLKKNRFKNFCADVQRQKRNHDLHFFRKMIFEKKIFYENKTNKNFNVSEILTKKKWGFH